MLWNPLSNWVLWVLGMRERILLNRHGIEKVIKLLWVIVKNACSEHLDREFKCINKKRGKQRSIVPFLCSQLYWHNMYNLDLWLMGSHSKHTRPQNDIFIECHSLCSPSHITFFDAQCTMWTSIYNLFAIYPVCTSCGMGREGVLLSDSHQSIYTPWYAHAYAPRSTAKRTQQCNRWLRCSNTNSST